MITLSKELATALLAYMETRPIGEAYGLYTEIRALFDAAAKDQ